MAANTNPIFGKAYRLAGVSLTTGFNTFTGADATKLLEADPVENSRLLHMYITPRGTNVAAVLRTFLSLDNGVTFFMLPEFPLLVTASSTVTQAVPLIMPMDLPLTPSAEIWVQLSTTVAGGWDIVGVVGDY